MLPYGVIVLVIPIEPLPHLRQLVFYRQVSSVLSGYFSWRNNYDGSWFVQAITRVFREHWDSLELMQLMTLVSKVVAYDFQSCTG